MILTHICLDYPL